MSGKRVLRPQGVSAERNLPYDQQPVALWWFFFRRIFDGRERRRKKETGSSFSSQGGCGIGAKKKKMGESVGRLAGVVAPDSTTTSRVIIT